MPDVADDEQLPRFGVRDQVRHDPRVRAGNHAGLGLLAVLELGKQLFAFAKADVLEKVNASYELFHGKSPLGMIAKPEPAASWCALARGSTGVDATRWILDDGLRTYTRTWRHDEAARLEKPPRVDWRRARIARKKSAVNQINSGAVQAIGQLMTGRRSANVALRDNPSDGDRKQTTC